MPGAQGILGSLRILVDADTAKAQKALQALGGRAQIAGAAIGAGLGVAGIAGLKMGDTYDAALDGVRASTGATGEELAALEKQIGGVGGRVTESLDVVGAAVATLHKRTGMVGDDLGATAESLIDLARLTGTDYAAAVDGVTQLYVNWNVAAEDQLAVNDMLLRAYQASGVSIDTLTASLDSSGAALRAAGFDLEESVALLASLEQAGVDATSVMGPLKKMLALAAKEGVPAGEAIEAVFRAIEDAPDATSAANVALQAFGAKGVQIAGLIREGRLDIEEMYAAIGDGGDTVKAASDDTRDFADGIREMINGLTMAVGPVTSVFAGISDAMGNAIFLLPALTGAIGKGLVKVAQSGAVKGAAAKAGMLIGRVMGLAIMGAQGVLSIITSSGAWAKAGALAGSKFGMAFKIAAAVGLALVAAQMAVQLGELRTANIQSAAANNKAMQDLIAEAPSREEAEKRLAGLRAVPETLDGVQGAILGFAGFADGNVLGSAVDALAGTNPARNLKEQIAALEGYLATLPPTITKTASGVQTAGAALETSVEESIDGLEGSGVSLADLGIDDGITEQFDAAAQAVTDGFGSIKAALANPPQIISRADRIENMEARVQKIKQNISKAIKGDDDRARQYWERGLASQEGRLDKFRGHSEKNSKAVSGKWQASGKATERAHQHATSVAISEANQARVGVVSAAAATAASVGSIFGSMNLASAGARLILTWVSGMRQMQPIVQATAASLAAAFSAYFKAASPPKVGPLSTIDKDGGSLVGAWLGGIGGKEQDVNRMGARIAGALAPGAGSLAARTARHGSGRGGGGDTYQIGVLVADDRGIDALDRRTQRRRRLRGRGQMRYQDVR
jgi:hypothetical protein